MNNWGQATVGGQELSAAAVPFSLYSRGWNCWCLDEESKIRLFGRFRKIKGLAE